MRTMQGGTLYHFYDGLWYDLAGTRTQQLSLKTTILIVHYSLSSNSFHKTYKVYKGILEYYFLKILDFVYKCDTLCY